MRLKRRGLSAFGLYPQVSGPTDPRSDALPTLDVAWSRRRPTRRQTTPLEMKVRDAGCMVTEPPHLAA